MRIHDHAHHALVASDAEFREADTKQMAIVHTGKLIYVCGLITADIGQKAALSK
jgi:hypothetical protein